MINHKYFFFFLFYFIFKLYIIVLVLPNIKMNPPQVLKIIVILSSVLSTDSLDPLILSYVNQVGRKIYCISTL